MQCFASYCGRSFAVPLTVRKGNGKAQVGCDVSAAVSSIVKRSVVCLDAIASSGAMGLGFRSGVYLSCSG